VLFSLLKGNLFSDGIGLISHRMFMDSCGYLLLQLGSGDHGDALIQRCLGWGPHEAVRRLKAVSKGF
jgi:hypothetical protein